jgi:hypothetical protein
MRLCPSAPIVPVLLYSKEAARPWITYCSVSNNSQRQDPPRLTRVWSILATRNVTKDIRLFATSLTAEKYASAQGNRPRR